MASMVLLGKDGKIREKIGSAVTLPPGYEVPDGCYLSWRHHFLQASCKIESSLIAHGAATVFLEPIMESIVAQIESPVAEDFIQAIVLTIQYVGGKIGVFEIPHNLSITEDSKSASNLADNQLN